MAFSLLGKCKPRLYRLNDQVYHKWIKLEKVLHRYGGSWNLHTHLTIEHHLTIVRFLLKLRAQQE